MITEPLCDACFGNHSLDNCDNARSLAIYKEECELRAADSVLRRRIQQAHDAKVIRAAQLAPGDWVRTPSGDTFQIRVIRRAEQEPHGVFYAPDEGQCGWEAHRLVRIERKGAA